MFCYSNPNFDGIQATWEPVGKDSFCYLEIEDYLHLVRKRVAEESLQMLQKMREITPFAMSKGGDTVWNKPSFHVLVRTALTSDKERWQGGELC